MWWVIGSIATYVVIGLSVFIYNASSGPLTLELCAWRGALWPLWMAGGLQGRPERMD